MGRSELIRYSVAGAAALTILAGPLAAQDTRVNVRVHSEGLSVPDAQVSAQNTGGITDDNGLVMLQLPAGQTSITVRHIGYAPTDTTIVVIEGEMAVAIELIPAAIEAEAIVVVSSTRADRRIEDEPIRVEAITREEVEEKLLMTPGDISMLLNETAGLRVQPTAPSLGGASVRIQGLRGRYTQVLSDGLPLYGGQTGALGPLQIPPMDLGQVEVIKGAASALYGSTALGGIVNLISRRPDNERELLLNQTTLGGTDVVAWSARELGSQWGYTLLGGAHRQAKADVDEDGWADLPGFQRASLRPRFFWDNGTGSSVFTTIGGMIESRKGGTVPGGTTPAGTAHAEEVRTRRLDAGLLGRFYLRSSQLLTVRGSTTLQAHRHLFGDATERDDHTTSFMEASLSGQAGRHLWLLGMALQHETYRGKDVPGFDFTFTTPAVFAQDEYAPAPWMTVSGSARLDHHSEYGTFVNPRLSLLFRPGAWVFRASAGTGYFAPTPFTEETEAVGLTRLESLEGLTVERATSGMLDVGRSLGDWEVNATVFASTIDDAVVATLAPSDKFTLSNSVDPVDTWGTELLARLERGPLHMTMTHVYTRSTEGNPDGSGRRTVPLNPEHTAGVVAAWEDEGLGRIGAELYYTGRQVVDDNPYRSTSEAYVVFGFLAELRVGSLRLFVNGENLLDARQTEHDPLVLPSRARDGRWITDVWGPLEGRAINGGVRISF